MRKLTGPEIAKAKENFQRFRERNPRLAAELAPLIEGADRLGDDPRLLKHFSETDIPPLRSELISMTFFPTMAEFDSSEMYPSMKEEQKR